MRTQYLDTEVKRFFGETHMKHSFVIDGIPMPYKKVKEADRRDFDDQKVRMNFINISIQNAFGDRPPLKGPLHLEVHFYFPIPSQMRPEQLNYTKTFPFKPNLSRLVDFIEDSVVGVLYDNKYMISSISAKKAYDTKPRTEFLLCELKDEKKQ